MASTHETLIAKFEDKSAVIGVIGLGYVGLPLVAFIARAGYRVIGFDVDDAKIESLLDKTTYIHHLPDALIAEIIDRGFEPTSDFSRSAECDAILICVPTPLNEHREPDMQYVVNSCETLAEYARPGQLYVLESTTWPGTTRELMLPIFEAKGLVGGEDVLLAYSPEREDPANKSFDTKSIPKIVGADSEGELTAAVALYSRVVDKVVPVSSSAAAEAAKILENTFRAVNIALVNELKVILTRMGIDVWEVIEAAATKPFGFMKFTPGPGLGGHCIPIDPFYLAWKAREFDTTVRFVEMAGEVNRRMPHYVVQRTMDAFSIRGKGLAGQKILLLGLAYKPDVDDGRESPSYKLMRLLEDKGCTVDYHDPFIPAIQPLRDYPEYEGRESVPVERAGEYDAVLISTNHSQLDYAKLLERAKLIIDTRGVYRGSHDKVIKA